MQEAYRDQSRLPALESLRSDIVFAVRLFGRTPGITALIVLTAGLGIGANTAIFSFLNQLLLKPLPYPEADRLVSAGRMNPAAGISAVSPREFTLLRENARTFDGFGVSFLHRGENVETAAGPQHLTCLRVSEGYFRALGVPPLLGRTFTREEDLPNGPGAAVLSYGLWQSAFGADPQVTGRSVRIAGKPVTVVGVMPEAFNSRARARLWLPLQSTGTGTDTNYAITARLAPGATAEQAATEVDALLWQLDRETEARMPAGRKFRRNPGGVVPLQQTSSSEFRMPVLLLYGGVCVLLMVACLNVGNLLLARAASRGREIAIRAAIGAGRGRIIRQMFTESLLLAGIGCLAGLGMGRIFIWGLTRLAPYPTLREVTLDATTLVFTVGVSLAAGIFFGLAPAWHCMRLGLNHTLKDGEKASASRSALRGRQVMVMTQVALCTVLLASAGLLVRTLANLRAVDIGFDPNHLWTAPMALNADKLASTEALTAYYEATMSRVRAIPGVTSIAVTTQLPVEGQFNMAVELPESTEPGRVRTMQVRSQTPDGFRTLGMHILRGRDFSESDRVGSTEVAVVNEAFAREFFRDGDPLGTHITMRHHKVQTVWTVTGVVNDVRETGLKRPAPPVVYTLIGQMPQPVLKLIHAFVPAKWVIRVNSSAGDVASMIRDAVRPLDPAQPFQEFRPMTTVVADTMRTERVLGGLLSAFAMLTLLMVASGLYGTLAYSVQQRRREIGVRMALGAGAANVIGMVSRSGLMQVASGLLIGLIASYWATRALHSFLFNLSPLDPATLAASAGVLLLVGLIAGCGPGLNAVRTNPAQTLRTE